MDYNVRYTRSAQRDLDAIYKYIDSYSPQGARAVKNAIKKRIDLLGSFPFMSTPTNHNGAYELSIIRYSYKVYYRVEENDVWILNIRHAKRQAWDGNGAL